VDIGTFNGRLDQWITSKETTLSKAGVGRYAQFFRADFTLSDNAKDSNHEYLISCRMQLMGEEHPTSSENTFILLTDMWPGNHCWPGMKGR